MSEIPDEVVERVAKAIRNEREANLHPIEWDWLADWAKEPYVKQARAALLECGWDKMIQAMSMMNAACARYDEQPDSTIARAYYQQALGDLRAALRKARGEK